MEKRAFVAKDDSKNQADQVPAGPAFAKVKLEVHGAEMIEKRVRASGNSGRVYLPSNWVGRHVKIIRID